MGAKAGIGAPHPMTFDPRNVGVLTNVRFGGDIVAKVFFG